MAVQNGVSTEFTLNGTTPVQLSAALSPNSKRHMVALFNKDSSLTITFAFGTGGTMPAGTGIPVPPGGNAIFGAYDADRLPGGDVYAIAPAGTAPRLNWTDYWT
jgi:hypothetical protein